MIFTTIITMIFITIITTMISCGSETGEDDKEASSPELRAKSAGGTSTRFIINSTTTIDVIVIIVIQ